MGYFHTEESLQLNNVRIALRALCMRGLNQEALPPEKLWPSTRDVAECCDISIYIARYYLIKLVETNQAYVQPSSAKSSLRWHIAESTPFIKQRKQKERLPDYAMK